MNCRERGRMTNKVLEVTQVVIFVLMAVMLVAVLSILAYCRTVIP